MAQANENTDIESLITIVTDPAYTGTKEAVALGDLRDTRAVLPLAAVAADRNRNVYMRTHVIDALAKIGDSRAVDPLVLALVDPNQSIRLHAARALGDIGDTRAIAPLCTSLEESSSVADEAEKALVKFGKLAVECLLSTLKSGEGWAPHIAAKILGQSGDERAVNALAAASRSTNSMLSERAVHALANLKEALGVQETVSVPSVSTNQASTSSVAESAPKASVQCGLCSGWTTSEQYMPLDVLQRAVHKGFNPFSCQGLDMSRVRQVMKSLGHSDEEAWRMWAAEVASTKPDTPRQDRFCPACFAVVTEASQKELSAVPSVAGKRRWWQFWK